MLAIDMNFAGGEALTAVLEKLFAGVARPKPALIAVGQEIESRISARFETETDPDGARWQKWAQSTILGYPRPGSKAAARAGRSGNNRLLDRFGDMLNSLSHEASSDMVKIGFGDPKAAYHEFGTKTMPRRGLIFSEPESGTLSASDEEAIVDIFMANLFQLDG